MIWLLSPSPTWWGCHGIGGPCWELGGRETPWEGHVLRTLHLWRTSWVRAHVWPEHWTLDPVVLGHRMLEAAGVLDLWASHGSAGSRCPGGRAVCGYQGMAGASSSWQVLEERQHLWLSELKRLYVEQLHEVTQKAERSERNLQLQLFMAQQEQRRLRKELQAQQGLGPEADPSARSEEEARWEVRD